MYTSETIGTLAGALAKAQGAIEAASKDTVNPFFKSKYASLAAVWEAARKPLSDNGLAVVQTTEATDEGMMLCTALIHSSGEWIHSFYPIRPVQDTPQGIGSALTYARRYSLSAMLGVVADDDDDGNAANAGKKDAPDNVVWDILDPKAAKSKTPPGNGKPQPAVEPVPLITEGQRKLLNQLGSQIYGVKPWDAKRHELVQSVTKGRTDTSAELTQVEADTLISGLERKKNQLAEEAKAKAAATPAPTDGDQASMLEDAAANNPNSTWGAQAL